MISFIEKFFPNNFALFLTTTIYTLIRFEIIYSKRSFYTDLNILFIHHGWYLLLYCIGMLFFEFFFVTSEFLHIVIRIYCHFFPFLPNISHFFSLIIKEFKSLWKLTQKPINFSSKFSKILQIFLKFLYLKKCYYQAQFLCSFF